MKRVLGPDYFAGDTIAIARGLIGMHVVRAYGGKRIEGMITETEAYDGPDDLASHASKGLTRRTSVMFGKQGRLYVYLIYGTHWMLNVVTGRKGYPAAVLIRGIDEVSGPGRVAKLLRIDSSFNGLPLGSGSGIWIEDRGTRITPERVISTPRIGVGYAGPVWSKKPYRFVLASG